MNSASPALNAHQHPRALRLPLSTALQYRSGTDHVWRRGKSLNMSFTGMLLAASHSLHVNDTVKLRFSLPSELTGEASPVVDLNCKVVRQAQGHRFGLRFLVAAIDLGDATLHDAETSRFHSLMHELSVIVGNCDILQHSAAMEKQTEAAVRRIKTAAMKVTHTLRKGIA